MAFVADSNNIHILSVFLHFILPFELSHSFPLILSLFLSLSLSPSLSLSLSHTHTHTHTLIVSVSSVDLSVGHFLSLPPPQYPHRLLVSLDIVTYIWIWKSFNTRMAVTVVRHQQSSQRSRHFIFCFFPLI